MRPIDADKINYTIASVYWGKDEDGKDIYRRTAIATESEIDNAPTIDADTYFDAVDRIKPCPNCRYMHIHKMLSENGQAPWVSVKDRLPKAWERVLVFYDGGFALAERLDDDYSGNPMWSYTGLGGDPSHWMPLPMGPEEE